VQVHQADHIKAVVLQRRLEKIAAAGAQVVEVSVRHHRARQRVVALVAEDALLDVPKSAVLETVAIESTDQCQQIGVRTVLELTRHPRHDPASAQQRQVERAAVEGGDAARDLDLVMQGLEKRGLHARLGQEELREAEPGIDRRRDGGGEGVRPGPAGETGGLSVDVGDAAGVGVERRQGNDVLADRGQAERRVDLLEPARKLVAPWLRPWSRRRS
jgi:hypothetical protein